MQISTQVIIVGGGLAGLSAAIYLARAKRDLLVIDSGKSMARWEPKVENYLGFPAGISGQGLLDRARRQAHRYGARFKTDVVKSARHRRGKFVLHGKNNTYACQKLLLATGVFHIPPDLHGFKSCIGRSMFFCKDCDGFRVQGKRIAVYGWTNETVRYALAMLTYAAEVCILTDGRKPCWDQTHGAALRVRHIPVFCQRIVKVRRAGPHLRGVRVKGGQERVIDALFTTRGDIVWNGLGKQLGADLDKDDQIITDVDMRTTLAGLYAAGCVTPANCQMIIAAGQGATAAQAINADLFEESLALRLPTVVPDSAAAEPRQRALDRRPSGR